MSGFERSVKKLVSIDLASLLKIEYGTEDGKFNNKKYSKALENFYGTIDEMEIYPFDDFLVIGVENFHELDKEHQRMFKALAKKIKELDSKQSLRELIEFVDGIKELASKYPELIEKK